MDLLTPGFARHVGNVLGSGDSPAFRGDELSGVSTTGFFSLDSGRRGVHQRPGVLDGEVSGATTSSITR